MEKIYIRISDNHLQGYMTVNSFEGLTLQYIIEYIQENGIVYGILLSEVQRVFENKITNTEVLIARGKEPINGKDGECINYIDRNVSFHTYKIEEDLEFGTIPIYNIRKRQKLLKIDQHTPGIQGISVDGKTIVAKDGKPVKLIRGRNIEFSKYNERYLLSKVDGDLTWDGKEVDISSDYKILGNVTAKNGHIDFVGNLIIEGDVSDVEIKTLGNLQIDGNVENAKITSSGSVTIKGKCYSSGKGIIFTKENIALSRVENYTIRSLKNITIKKECSISTIEAFSILAPEASITGGSLSAFEVIDVNNLGYGANILTKVIIGNKLYKMRLTKGLEKNIEACQMSLIELNKRYGKSLSKKMRTGFIAPEEEIDMFLLKEDINEVTTQINDLLSWRIELVKNLSNSRDSKLVVNGSIYPNVSLYINDLRYENSRIFSSSIFMGQDNEVTRIPK